MKFGGNTKKFLKNPPLLGENLLYLIESHNLNSAELAQALDIPVMTIRRLISGETIDPRISTLKLIADYFHTSIDSLISEDKPKSLQLENKAQPQFLPILDWHIVQESNFLEDINLKEWKRWHPISLSKQEKISKSAFILESRPSMYPRFPQGTMFVIDLEPTPIDGDIVLVKIIHNSELTLRELIVDPPQKHLHPIISNSNVLQYNKKDYKIVGVVILTMLYSRK